MKPSIVQRPAAVPVINHSSEQSSPSSEGWSVKDGDWRLDVAQTASLIVIATLVTAYTLYFARAIFLPVAVAVVCNFLFQSVVRRLERIGVPNWPAC